MRCSILSRVCLVRQWWRTWTACNLVADGFSKSHNSDVLHETERYKNLQLENTHVVEIQLPDQIEFRNQSLKCVCVCSCFLCKQKTVFYHSKNCLWICNRTVCFICVSGEWQTTLLVIDVRNKGDIWVNLDSGSESLWQTILTNRHIDHLPRTTGNTEKHAILPGIQVSPGTRVRGDMCVSVRVVRLRWLKWCTYCRCLRKHLKCHFFQIELNNWLLHMLSESIKASLIAGSVR